VRMHIDGLDAAATDDDIAALRRGAGLSGIRERATDKHDSGSCGDIL